MVGAVTKAAKGTEDDGQEGALLGDGAGEVLVVLLGGACGEEGGGVGGGGGGVGRDQRAGDGDVDGSDRRVEGEAGDDKVHLAAARDGAGEARAQVDEGVEVGNGSVADDLGEGVVAPSAAGCGATGALVVGVGEEVEPEDGGGEAAALRRVAGALRVAVRRKRRRKEGEGPSPLPEAWGEK